MHLWESGQRYPDASSQVTIHKVLGLNPAKIYLNDRHCILTIPVELLKKMGEPLFFSIRRFRECGKLLIVFMDKMDDNGPAFQRRFTTENDTVSHFDPAISRIHMKSHRLIEVKERML